jgi:hypothetical protein
MTATRSQPVYHRNAAGGPAIKGVECKRCGEYVGIVQSAKTGKWYTCQLHLTMNPDKSNLVAYPFQPHGPHCGEQRRRYEAERAEREATLRRAVAICEKALTRDRIRNDPEERAEFEELLAENRRRLIDEGFAVSNDQRA